MTSTRFNYVIAVNIFFITLVLIYLNIIGNNFAYEGFNIDFSLLKMFFGLLLIFPISLFFPIKKVSVLSFFSSLYIFFIIFPIIVLYVCDFRDPLALLGCVISSYLVVFFNYFFNKYSLSSRFITIRGSYKFVSLISFSLVAFFLFYIYYSGAINNISFNIDEVYNLRNTQGEYLYTGIWAYLTNWIIKVFSIIALILAAKKKSYLMVLLMLSVLMVFFGVTTHKSTFFYGMLSLLVYYNLDHRFQLKLIKYFLFFSVLIIFISNFFDLIYITSFLFRRAIFTPARLYYEYSEFFTINEFIYWSNSFLSEFLVYPYDKSPAQMIGSFMGFDGMSANNGFLASGFMHAGLFGIIIYTFTFIFILLLLDIISNNLDKRFTIAICIAPLVSLITSSDLTTSLLTHGLAILILMIYFLNSKKIQ